MLHCYNCAEYISLLTSFSGMQCNFAIVYFLVLYILRYFSCIKLILKLFLQRSWREIWLWHCTLISAIWNWSCSATSVLGHVKYVNVVLGVVADGKRLLYCPLIITSRNVSVWARVRVSRSCDTKQSYKEGSGSGWIIGKLPGWDITPMESVRHS